MSILYKFIKNDVKAYNICEKCKKEIDETLDGVFLFSLGRVEEGNFLSGKEILYYHSDCLESMQV